MMFARGGDDDGYDYSDEDADLDQPPARASRRVVRPDSPGTSSGAGGRQRSIQFQPEERYWTDYLRIALPIIGLLLMVGLFWYWAQQLIDDPAGPDQPVATTTAPGVAALDDTESTPQPTAPPAGNTGNPAAGATRPPAAAPTEVAPTEAAPPQVGSSGDAAFAPEDRARINEPGVNMRAAPTTGGSGTINATLEADTAVTIQSGPEESDGYVWWEIIVDETGESGWVVEQYLEAVE